MVKKASIYIVVLLFALLHLPYDLYAKGQRPTVFILARVPVDPQPFERFQDYDLREFPWNLCDEADNAFYEAFRRLGGQVRQAEVFQNNNPDEIGAFYDRIKAGRTTFAKDFCIRTDPMINILITFELAMDPEEITTDHIRLKLHTYYLTKERDEDPTVWHRNRILNISPEDYEDWNQKVIDAIFSLIEEYRKNPVP